MSTAPLRALAEAFPVLARGPSSATHVSLFEVAEGGGPKRTVAEVFEYPDVPVVEFLLRARSAVLELCDAVSAAERRAEEAEAELAGLRERLNEVQAYSGTLTPEERARLRAVLANGEGLSNAEGRALDADLVLETGRANQNGGWYLEALERQRDAERERSRAQGTAASARRQARLYGLLAIGQAMRARVLEEKHRDEAHLLSYVSTAVYTPRQVVT